MYLCLDCNCVFDEPSRYIDKLDLDGPPYMEWEGCPACGSGAYVDALYCDQCGNVMTGDYVKVNDGTLICENCYELKNVEDGIYVV